MAAIHNSIQLQDRMTPVLRSIIKSMESTLKVMERLDKQTKKGEHSKAFKQATREIENANSALQRMQNQLIKVDNNAKMATSTLSRMSNSIQNADTGMNRLGNRGINLVNLTAAVYLLQNIAGLINKLMEVPDEAISLKARIGLFNESEYTKEQLFDELYNASLRTRTGFKESGQLATRIMISGAMTGENAATGAIKATELINKAVIAGGSTAEESRRSLLQLSQALASGMLQGDELRAIREQTPFLARMIGEGLAKVDPKKFAGVSIGQLKELGRQGELTSDRILKGLFLMSDEINEYFKQMPRTFGQAMTQMGSIWMKFMDKLNQVDGPMQKLTQLAWQFVDFLASEDGEDFLTGLASGIGVVVDSIVWFFNLVGDAFSYLSENLTLTKALISAVAAAAVVGAGAMFVSWTIANWPVIAVLAGLTAIFYALYKMGHSAGDIIGGIILFFMRLGNAIITVFRYISAGGQWVGEVLKGFFGTALDTIYNMFVFLVAGLSGIMGSIAKIFGTGLTLVGKFFEGLIVGVLNGMEKIAQAADKIFGSNLAGSVEGWKTFVQNRFAATYEILDKRYNEMPNFGDYFENAPWADWSNNYTPRTFQEILADTHDFGIMTDEEAKKWTSDFGNKIDDKLAATVLGIDNAYQNIMENFDPNNIEYINSIGEVGKINSDVEISDEDIQILRDIAAKDFLVNLYTIAPQVNAQFGDVRESADVNEIMGVLETMIEEAYATSLISK